MKNFEKYIDELIKENGEICGFVNKYLLKDKSDCFLTDWSCQECRVKLFRWLNEEYKPQIDWSKVPVDTPVIVSNGGSFFKNRHFAGFNAINDRCFATFAEGKTSFTANGALEHWLKCELARPEDIEKYSI